jgi:hypothetical protein
MSQLRSFILAIELATRQRDELARALARAEKTLQFAQNQMHQLECGRDRRALAAPNGRGAHH